MNFENFELYWASRLVAGAWELLPSLPAEVRMNARLARCEGTTNGVCVYVLYAGAGVDESALVVVKSWWGA